MEITDIYSAVIGGVVSALVVLHLTITLVLSIVLYLRANCSARWTSGLWRTICRICPLPSCRFLLQVLYVGGTGVCNFFGVKDVSQAGSRAAKLAISNLIPLCFIGPHDVGARLLRLSLRNYKSFHVTIGIMALLQSLPHAVIATRSTGIVLTDDVQLCGFLVRLGSPAGSGITDCIM